MESVAAGLAAGLVSSIPMLGPVVLLLMAAGARGERSRGLALAAGAAASEAVHVAVASLGVGPLLLAEPAVAIGLRLASGVVLVVLAVVAWRARPGDGARVVPPGRWRAAGLGVLLVLPNPGFLVVWVALTAWLAGLGVTLGAPFVVGATLGIFMWFAAVLALSSRLGPTVAARHGRTLARALALALAAFGVWAFVGALHAA